MTRKDTDSARAALAALIILQIVMLGALYAKTPPHPPEFTPLFGIAPFLGASLSTAAAALMLGANMTGAGRSLCLLSALLAAVSFGPQKYLDGQFHLIWPAVIAGQIAIVALCVAVFEGRRHESADKSV